MEIILHQAALLIEVKDNLQNLTVKIYLTRSEYFILFELLKAKGKHLTKDTLKNAGWPDSYVCDNALTVSIMTLRKKLKKNSDCIKIKTIQRVGYSLYCTTNDLIVNTI